MTWNAPYTPSPATAFTYSQLQTYIFDNLNETAVAKAQHAGAYFVATGPNALAERQFVEELITDESITNQDAYSQLATGGPSATVLCSTAALIHLAFKGKNENAAQGAIMSYEINLGGGAENRSVRISGDAYQRNGISDLVTVTQGSHQFRGTYRSTLDGTNAHFDQRNLIAMPL